MDGSDVTRVFLALGLLLGLARLFGELARRLRQPAVLGEIVAGMLLGPTVLGRIAPGVAASLFPTTGAVAVFLSGFATISVALFLLVAGLEVDLATVWRQGRRAIVVSLAGIIVPFAIGFTCAWAAPRSLGIEPDADRFVFALFFATALSISSLPVIARTLLDLGLFRTDFGMIIMAAAIFQDLVGWCVFASILGMMGGAGVQHFPMPVTIALTVGFAIFSLTVLRWLLHRALPFLHAFASWPAGVIGLTATIALLASAFTEWIGVHAIFGSFMTGVAIGDSKHLRERTRATLDQFVSSVFAPIFFASIGLHINFIAKFDPLLVMAVLLIACIGKIVGVVLGARLSGVGKSEAWAVGFGMNARGAMEIILGLLAYEAGVIRERMLVALLVMALVTSMISGPAIQRLLRRRRAIDLADHLAILHPLSATDPSEAIRDLCCVAAREAGLDPQKVEEPVMAREAVTSTALEMGIAVPHAEIDGISKPIVAVGTSSEGIDIGSVDGMPSNLVFLVLVPKGDPESQIQILAGIARAFHTPDVVRRALHARSLVELLALVRVEAQLAGESPVPAAVPAFRRAP